ncbi:hypothetical protein N7540_005513 [Penicillium herquei]|nr:hypothetical protein N7540_005513 [Penicillium herquei]
MEKLLAAKVPAGMLNGKELCPWPALPMPHGLTGPAPVVTLQANFICGGLILTLASHNTIMDGAADFQFFKMFFDFLNGRELEPVDLEQANRDRSQLIRLIPEARGQQFDNDVQISSDDILSVFYWKRICALRIARGIPPDTESKCSRTINTRAALGISSSYIGAQISPCVTRLSMARVTEFNIAQLAQILRTDLMEAATPWAVRSFATFISRKSPEARAKLLYTGRHDSNTDIGFTNMSKLERPQGSWGPLGPCRFYRHPNAAPIPGSFRTQEPEKGSYPIMICLPGEDLQALKEDREWNQFAKFIG